MISTRHRRTSDIDEGDGILYEIVDTDLVWSETKFGGVTPTRWPVVPLGRTNEPGCIVWSRSVYFRKRGPGQPGGPAFVSAAREQERVAAARQWLVGPLDQTGAAR